MIHNTKRKKFSTSDFLISPFICNYFQPPIQNIINVFVCFYMNYRKTRNNKNVLVIVDDKIIRTVVGKR